MPQISVIVPVYKVEPYLRRCVDSILAQSFSDFELILVDDGSPDNSGVICDEYAKADTRVVVIHQENGGLSAARNAAIDWMFANSDSQWLTFIDSDDWVHPEYLERLLNAAIENDVKVSVCNFKRTVEQEVFTSIEDFLVEIWTPEDFYVHHGANGVIACCKLYQKDCFANMRYPVGKLNEDEFVTYKILFPLSSIAVIAAPMYFYYQNPCSITGSAWTPARLCSLIAQSEQANYFLAGQFTKAYQFNQGVQIRNIQKQMYQIQQTTLKLSTKKKYQRKLRASMRKLLQNNKKLFPFHQHYSDYELAYPTGMHLYWFLQVVRKKLKRM